MPKTCLVLLAAHDGARWLDAQVQSILAQQGVRVQLLAGDDGSSDGTLDLLRGLAAGDARVTVRQSPASGGAAQHFFHLLGLAELAGVDYVAFSDQDDVWFPDKLARAVQALASRDAVGYSSAVEAQWPDGRRRVLTQNTVMTAVDFLFEGAGQGCTFVLRADFARCLQGLLPACAPALAQIHYHDWAVYALARTLPDVTDAAAAAGASRWVFDPVPSMTYRQHDGNDTGARVAWAGVFRRLGLIRNGWYSNQVRAVADLVFLAQAHGPACAQALADARHMRGLLARSGGVRGRLALAAVLWRQGRRRRSDRLVLALAALAGWLAPKGLSPSPQRERMK